MTITRLRDKLLLGSVAISIVLGLGAMSAVSWVIRRQHLDQSNAALLKASSVIAENLDERKEVLAAVSHQFAAQKNLGSTIWYLTQYEKSDMDRETLFNSYRQLVWDTYQAGQIGKVSKITVYNPAGNLVSFAVFDRDSDRAGFVERVPAPLFRVAAARGREELDWKNLKTTNSVAEIGLEFDGRLPQRESVHYAVVDGRLSIESRIPIMGEAFDAATGKPEIKQLGLVAMVQPLDQPFADRLSRLTDTRVNVFTPQGFSSGSLAAYRKPGWDRAQAEAASQTPAITLDEITIEGVDYFQMLMPLYADNKLVGTIAALHSKETVQKNIREMIRILWLIAAASVLLIFPFVWYFATSISHPLTVLSRIFRGVAGGMQTGALIDELRKLDKEKKRQDELGDLTQSFIAMADTVNQKTLQNASLYDELKEANERLEIKVLQRTRELEKLKQEAEQLARIDPLTGLLNRRAFFEQAMPAMNQAKRHRSPLSLVMMDIDHFKCINDAYGHDIGDEVLKAVADQIKAVARSSDVPARIGGEEFVILLTGTDIEEARAFSERLRARLAAMRIDARGRALQLSSSFGITGYGLDDADIYALLRRSDTALYQAKNGGRNCVVVMDVG